MSNGDGQPTFRVRPTPFVIAAVLLFGMLVVGLFGGWRTVSDATRDEDRDWRIKSIEKDQWHTEERIQKQIDELRARVEKLEAR